MGITYVLLTKPAKIQLVSVFPPARDKIPVYYHTPFFVIVYSQYDKKNT